MSKAYEIFKALGEENRFRCTALLIKAGKELCACELIDALGKPQYTVSKSMSALVDAGIVEDRRDGKMMFYRLRTEDEQIKALIEAVKIVMFAESYQWKKDFDKLSARLNERTEGKCVNVCNS
jgi:ArsR family transcriptional regulator, arsenate/arsenite/antimonite-responsive transcriptional repressor